MLDSTEAFLALVDRIARENIGALETLPGSLMIDVQGVATRTIVTSGPRKGIYDEATDDPLAFAFSVPESALLHLLEPDPEYPFDLEAAIEAGTVLMEGDSRVYEAFMRLDRQKRSLISVRLH